MSRALTSFLWVSWSSCAMTPIVRGKCVLFWPKHVKNRALCGRLRRISSENQSASSCVMSILFTLQTNPQNMDISSQEQVKNMLEPLLYGSFWLLNPQSLVLPSKLMLSNQRDRAPYAPLVRFSRKKSFRKKRRGRARVGQGLSPPDSSTPTSNPHSERPEFSSPHWNWA